MNTSAQTELLFDLNVNMICMFLGRAAVHLKSAVNNFMPTEVEITPTESNIYF